MSYATCDHLMADGVFCSSPALRNQRFCYFHLDLRARRVQMAQALRKGESCRLRLPVLDNMHAVQAALQQVGDALADDRIDFRRANALLYLLQQAAALRSNTPSPSAPSKPPTWPWNMGSPPMSISPFLPKLLSKPPSSHPRNPAPRNPPR